jgi:hypothetical protein
LRATFASILTYVVIVSGSPGRPGRRTLESCPQLPQTGRTCAGKARHLARRLGHGRALEVGPGTPGLALPGRDLRGPQTWSSAVIGRCRAGARGRPIGPRYEEANLSDALRRRGRPSTGLSVGRRWRGPAAARQDQARGLGAISSTAPSSRRRSLIRFGLIANHSSRPFARSASWRSRASVAARPCWASALNQARASRP